MRFWAEAPAYCQKVAPFSLLVPHGAMSLRHNVRSLSALWSQAQACLALAFSSLSLCPSGFCLAENRWGL